MNTTTNSSPVDDRIFGLSNPPSVEDIQFLEEIGMVLIESVLLQYMLTLEPVARTEFESWVQAHASAADFLLQVCEAFPAVALLFTQEIEAAQSEAALIVAE